MISSVVISAASAANMLLWYDKTAIGWEAEALPIGNGRLGAMIFGGIEHERIPLNEDSLWIGDETDTGAYQAFGDLLIDFGDGAVTGYAGKLREMDVKTLCKVGEKIRNPTNAVQ